MRPHALLLSALVLAPVASSQEPGRYLPRGATLYLHCDAPATLRKAFRPTDLGALLESREMQDLFEPVSAAIEGLMAGEGGDLPPQLERIGELLEGFEGRLRVAWQVDPPKADEIEPGVLFAAELAGGDTEALREMGRLCSELAEFADRETVDFTVAGETFRGWTEEGGPTVLLPKLLGSSLVFYMGNGVEDRVAEILGREGGAVPDGLEGSAVAVRVDIERLLEVSTALLDAVGGPMEAERLWKVLRVDGLRDLVVSARPEGPRTRLDLEIGFDPQRPNVLEFLRPEQDGRPRLLGLVPRQHRYWSVQHFRLDVLYDWAAELLVALEAPMDMSGVEEWFEEQCKVRLKDDLLAHMGDEMLTMSSTEPGDPDSEDPNEAMGGLTLAFELDDAAAFEQSFERLLRSRGLHVGRKSREYRGVEVRVLNLFGGMIELHYAFGDDVVMFGFGKETDQLNQLLDRLAARRQGEEPGSFPDRVQERLQSMPAGWQAVGVTHVPGIFEGLAGVMRGALYQGLPQEAHAIVAEMVEWAGTIGRLVERYDLDLLVSASRVGKDRVVSRTIW